MCDSPIIITPRGEKYKDMLTGKEIVSVHDRTANCGSCPVCRGRKVSDWILRLEEEDRVSSSSYFITLTYDTWSVPITKSGRMSVHRPDVIKFMKKLRKKQKQKIKVYVAAEYGTKSWRPHYHMIIFNLEGVEEKGVDKYGRPVYVSKRVEEAWSFYYKKERKYIPIGSIHIGTVSGASIAYTLEYISKPKKVPQYKGDDRTKEFSYISNGLGKSWTERAKNYEYIKNHNYISHNGYKKGIPRYWKDKMLDPERDYHPMIKHRRDAARAKYEKQLKETRRVNKLYNKKVHILDYRESQRQARWHKHIKNRDNGKESI